MSNGRQRAKIVALTLLFHWYLERSPRSYGHVGEQLNVRIPTGVFGWGAEVRSVIDLFCPSLIRIYVGLDDQRQHRQVTSKHTQLTIDNHRRARRCQPWQRAQFHRVEPLRVPPVALVDHQGP